MNYHHLYYFWKVADSGHLTKTAETLHISQSALSSQIKQLEQWFGQPLFERRGRKLLLTQAGYIAKQTAERIFKEGEQLVEQLKNGASSKDTVIRIGHASTMSRNFIEQVISELMKQPHARYRLHSMAHHQLLTELSEYRIDVALANTEVTSSDQQIWQSKLLARQAIYIVGVPGYPISSLQDPQLKRQQWVLPPENTPIRGAFDMLSTEYQWRPEIIAEADDMAMLRLLVRDSGALAAIPDVVVRDELQSGLLQRYLQLPNVYEQFYAITVKQPFPNTAVSALLQRFNR
ncbi:LysR family transcriptional regulator [Idiomarina tyrosinivorans]|uniref:LysR family transcriptional regulator n=1 Tax=Idiomarina tyrosinivorans TaxID=1445662 RepID=A0A432ZTQ1_9GAMM|nr:LysR family transcriptional regulator [Idiomarina tyrosinivorans]RUO81222.1 LysR family transcriptional regulator [Idiomarina tyrosinivorans]